MEAELLKIGAAYVRVSDERQDEYSPDSQLKKIREYAEKEGYIIPDEYIFYDDGISGKSTKRKARIGKALICDLQNIIEQATRLSFFYVKVGKQI
jgi:DNA invertase Pin-like site-specific DNA recombinase